VVAFVTKVANGSVIAFVAVVTMVSKGVIDFVVAINILLPKLPMSPWLHLLPCLPRCDVNIIIIIQ
jgi:hypothetical protein